MSKSRNRKNHKAKVAARNERISQQKKKIAFTQSAHTFEEFTKQLLKYVYETYFLQGRVFRDTDLLDILSTVSPDGDETRQAMEEMRRAMEECREANRQAIKEFEKKLLEGSVQLPPRYLQ